MVRVSESAKSRALNRAFSFDILKLIICTFLRVCTSALHVCTLLKKTSSSKKMARVKLSAFWLPT